MDVPIWDGDVDSGWWRSGYIDPAWWSWWRVESSVGVTRACCGCSLRPVVGSRSRFGMIVVNRIPRRVRRSGWPFRVRGS